MKKLSYAQNSEDVLLHRVFPTGTGFYIDVGACHPVLHSVTKHFSERGWHGINIEPITTVHKMLCADRPHDINLNVGLSNREGVLTFFEATSSLGWSTFSPKLAAGVRQIGVDFVERSVPVMTLAGVCERYVDHDQTIDFLKIDVEDHEREVLEGADWKRWRPRVMLIEGVDPEPWEELVLAADYLFACFDGINRYYVRAEDRELLPVLSSAPANSLDGFELYESHQTIEDLRSQLASARAALGEIEARYATVSARLAPFEGLGPDSLAMARRLRRMATRFPNLSTTVKRLLRPTG